MKKAQKKQELENIEIEVEDLVVVNKGDNYSIEPELAIPVDKNTYYLFKKGIFVPEKDYKHISRVEVDPVTIIKNEGKMNESKEVYNFSPLTLSDVATLEKALSNHQENMADKTYVCDRLYIFQNVGKNKENHICFKLEDGQYYNILKHETVNNEDYKFKGRLNLIGVNFGKLRSGLFYLDENDVKNVHDKINIQRTFDSKKDENTIGAKALS